MEKRFYAIAIFAITSFPCVIMAIGSTNAQMNMNNSIMQQQPQLRTSVEISHGASKQKRIVGYSITCGAASSMMLFMIFSNLPIQNTHYQPVTCLYFSSTIGIFFVFLCKAILQCYL